LQYRHGNQGILDGASNQTLEAEFGTSKDDDVVKQILEKGSIQETEVSPLTCALVKSNVKLPY